MLLLFIGNYIKTYKNNSNLSKKNAEEHNALNVILLNLTKKVEISEKKLEYSEKLFNNITQTGISILHNNIDLDSKIIRLMNSTLTKVRAFAIRHINSHFRVTRKDLEEYIRISSLTIYKDLDALADDLFPSETTKYSDFVKHETNQIEIITNMANKLIINGLSPKEYIILFDEFIEALFKEQIKGWRKWNSNIK